MLSLPEALQDPNTEEPYLAIPENISAMISDDNTFLLLNKSDLIPPLDTRVARRLELQAQKLLGVKKVWAVSLTTSEGIEMFLEEFGDNLKKR